MQLVIRTAHGSADVDVESFDDDTTLRDMLVTITGLAPPAIVHVDGRPCRVDDRLLAVIAALELQIGSIVDLTSDRGGVEPTGEPLHTPGTAGTPLVRLRQLSGRGTGTSVALPPGQYRFGAGRRLVDGELVAATVEEEAFTISVAPPSPQSPSPSDHQPHLEPADGPVVTIRPGANVAGQLGPLTPTLDGQLFDRELEWRGGRLSVGGRVFDLVHLDQPTDESDEPGTSIGIARIGAPDRAGIRSFDAAGTVAVLGEGQQVPTEPTFAALSRVDEPTRTLWRRRPHDDGFSVPVGLSGDHDEVVSVDLHRHRGIAISGSPEFTAGVARTVVTELTTALGPGDLDVVVVASAGRLGRWDWMKWLPHARGGDPSAAPTFLTTDDDVAAWRATRTADGHDATPGGRLLQHSGWDPPRVGGRPAASTELTALPPPSGRPHARPTSEPTARRTLLLVDDAAHWMRRESPLRSMLIDPRSSLRVLTTLERLADAPGSCSALIDELRPNELLDAGGSAGAQTSAATQLFGSLCRLIERLGSNPIVTTDVRPALTQTSTATSVARRMAGYDDLRVRRDEHGPETSFDRSDRPTLATLVAFGDRAPDADAGAESAGAPTSVVPVGRVVRSIHTRPGPGASLTSDEVAMIDLADAQITAVAVDGDDRRQVLGAITLGVAARHEPDRLGILLVADEEPRWISPLPHLIGTVDGDDTEQVGRVLRRIAATLARDPDFELLVIVDEAIAPSGPSRVRDATLAFIELAGSLERVHLVVSTATEHADALRRHLGTACGAFLEGRPGGVATLARRSAALDIGTARVMTTTDVLLPVVTTPPPPAPPAGLRVTPFVFGRPLSPIERRLARQNDPLHHGALGPLGGSPGDAELSGAAVAAAGNGLHDPHRGDELLPPPFPDRFGQETILPGDDRPGDGTLALGITDRPDDVGIDVLRWAPESGSLIAVGHRRSGMNAIVELVAAALADVDADVWVLDPLPQRRRAFRRLPHCQKTAEPDSEDAITRFLDDIDLHLERVRRRQHDTAAEVTPDHLKDAIRGGPRPIVVVIADLNRTLAASGDGAADLTERLARLATGSEGGGTGPAVALVVAASRHHEVEPLLRHSAEVLVGAIDERDRITFGVPDRPLHGGPRKDIPGRSWSTARRRIVQLATPPDQLERFIRHRVDRLGMLGHGESDASETDAPSSRIVAGPLT